MPFLPLGLGKGCVVHTQTVPMQSGHNAVPEGETCSSVVQKTVRQKDCCGADMNVHTSAYCAHHSAHKCMHIFIFCCKCIVMASEGEAPIRGGSAGSAHMHADERAEV